MRHHQKHQAFDRTRRPMPGLLCPPDRKPSLNWNEEDTHEAPLLILSTEVTACRLNDGREDRSVSMIGRRKVVGNGYFSHPRL